MPRESLGYVTCVWSSICRFKILIEIGIIQKHAVVVRSLSMFHFQDSDFASCCTVNLDRMRSFPVINEHLDSILLAYFVEFDRDQIHIPGIYR